jgi:hypothetical protein
MARVSVTFRVGVMSIQGREITPPARSSSPLATSPIKGSDNFY